MLNIQASIEEVPDNGHKPWKLTIEPRGGQDLDESGSPKPPFGDTFFASHIEAVTFLAQVESGEAKMD